MKHAKTSNVAYVAHCLSLVESFQNTSNRKIRKRHHAKDIQGPSRDLLDTVQADVLFGPEQTRRQTELQATDDGTALLEAMNRDSIIYDNIREWDHGLD